MAVGIEIYNDWGVPQLLNGRGINICFHSKGTISVGSNTAATGTSGNLGLTAAAYPYLVFIRTAGAAQAFGTLSGWSWRMAQGTTSFDYWIFGQPLVSGNCGFQVFNADGSLQWDASQRPLNIYGAIQPTGTIPYAGEMSTSNNLGGPLYNGWNNAAYCMSDMGMCLDVYTYTGGGNTVRANMRYYPMISTPNASQIQLQYARVRSNRSNSLGSNTSYSASRLQLPSFLLACQTF